MAVHRILKMGHPKLLQVSEPVEKFSTPKLDALVEDMFDTMAANSGAGLAAPQIGINQRIVIFGVTANPRYPDAESVPTTVLINPKIEILTEEKEEDWEGCLSVPGLRGLVRRPNKIRYRGFDHHGQPIDRSVSGFHARVVQHEVDHLDGILYPMQMENLRLLGFEDELFKTE